MKKIIGILLSMILASGVLFFFSCEEVDSGRVARSTYNITATIDPSSRRVDGVVVIDYINVSDLPLSELNLQLYANSYKTNAIIGENYREQVYYNGESVGSITIGSIRINDNQTGFSLTEEGASILIIPLVEELYPMERVNVGVSFALIVPEMIARLGVTPNAINLANWYPQMCSIRDGEWITDEFYYIGDPYVSDMADYKATITVPYNYTVAVSGVKKYETRKEDCLIVEVEAPRTRDFAVVVSDKFKLISALAGGVKVQYYYLDDVDPEKSLSIAKDAINVFAEAYGNYTYTTYSVVETDLIAGGMEYSSLSLIKNGTEGREKETIIVHETAHQWWYNLVGNDSIKNAWMDEGLAEFSTLYYYKIQYGESEYLYQLNLVENQYMLYTDLMEMLDKQASTSMTRSIYEYASEYEYIYMCYVKSMLMYSNMYEIMGEKFIDGLANYVAKCSNTIATPEQMIGAIEDRVGRRLDIVFNAWLYGKIMLLPLQV